MKWQDIVQEKVFYVHSERENTMVYDFFDFCLMKAIASSEKSFLLLCLTAT